VQGDSSISITHETAGRRSSTASSTPSAVTAGVLSGFFLLLLGAGLASAAPAWAVDDPSRPDARVTHGPSCRPGGLVVEVTAGTAPYFVRLATTRQPAGEDQATLAPGTTVTLRTADVAWGETIDGRLEFAAHDGSGVTFVDELENYSFTRPTQEDCAAVNAPTEPHPSPTAPSPSAEAPGPGAGEDGTSPSPGRTPGPFGEPQETDAGAVPGVPSGPGGASAAAVAPGDTVTVSGTGFRPGERVVVRLAGGALLGSVTAAADGSVRAEVRIPERTETGRTTVNLVGDDSAVSAGIDLRVAALSVPADDDGVGTLVPLVAAAGALVATAAGLVSVVGRQRAAAARGRPLNGSA
jgi:hypothetical protein